MSTRDKVALLIGGKMHDDWESYEVASDLMTPADAWRVTLGLKDGRLPAAVVPGVPVQIQVGGDLVMSGRVDEIEHEVEKDAHTLAMSGRDGAAVLVDCSAPIFTTKLSSLEEIIAKVVRPLGISKIKIDADSARTREKVNVEPGDTAWDTVVNVCEANGLWPWFAPDGTLVIGGPDYSTPSVADLIIRTNGQGNNLVSLALRASMAERYSEVTVLGQGHGTELEAGKHALKATAKDAEVNHYRPHIVLDQDAEHLATVHDRARKLIADSRLSGFTLQARVAGHRTSAGVLWAPGQRVHVLSEPHGIDGIYFLMARTLRSDHGTGTTTELTLKEDGVWVLDAHPRKGKRRKEEGDYVWANPDFKKNLTQ